jgi:hypothetical protein
MSIYGPNYPGTVTGGTNTVNNVIWSNPTSLVGGPGLASQTLTFLQYEADYSQSHLTCTNFNFGIASGDTVTGIEVDALIYASENSESSYVTDYDILLWYVGSEGLNHARSGVYWPTTESAVKWGGDSDVWNLNSLELAVSRMNNADMGVSLWPRIVVGLPDTNSVTAYVASVTMTVYTNGSTGSDVKQKTASAWRGRLGLLTLAYHVVSAVTISEALPDPLTAVARRAGLIVPSAAEAPIQNVKDAQIVHPGRIVLPNERR